MTPYFMSEQLVQVHFQHMLQVEISPFLALRLVDVLVVPVWLK